MVPIVRSFSGQFFTQLYGGAGAAATMTPFITRFKIMPADSFGCMIPFDTAVAAAPAPPPDGTCYPSGRYIQPDGLHKSQEII